MTEPCSQSGGAGKLVFCRFIRKNGKKIYPKNGRVFRFYVKRKSA